MSDDVTVNISGLDELQQKLSEQAPQIARRVLREAGDKAGEILRAAIADRAPRDTGFLSGHIVMTSRLTDGHLVVVIGPQGDAGYFRFSSREGEKLEFQGSPHYAAIAARMAEFGSKHQAAKPFMRPAFDASSEDALNVFVDTLREALNELEQR